MVTPDFYTYRQRLDGWLAIAIPVALTIGLVVLLHYGDIRYLPPPAMLFLVPVLVAAALHGWRLAMVCWALVSVALLSGYLPSPRQGIEMLLNWILPFGLISFTVSWVIEQLRRTYEESELRRRWHESTLAHIGDVVIVTNSVGEIAYVNRSGAELVGVDGAAMVGRQFEQFFDIRDVHTDRPVVAVVNHWQQFTHTFQQQVSQVLVRADGQRIPVEVTVAPVRDPQSQLRSMVYTLRDRTLQHSAERVTQERLLLQSRLEHIALSLPSAMHEYRVLRSGQRLLSYASVGFVRITGMEPELFATDASSLDRMVHADDRASLWAALQQSVRSLARVEHEFRVVTTHRGVVWVSLSSQPSREAQGVIVFRGSLTDITARKQAEEQLYASQVRLRAALDAGGMGLVRIDVQSGAVEMDGVARAMCGLPTSAAQPLSVNDLLPLIHPEDRLVIANDYREMAHVSRSYQRRFRLAATGQRVQWIECRGRVYQDESIGAPVMMGVLADVTDLFQNAERNLHSQKLEALGVLAGGIAHDFNNLLQAISGNALLLLNELPMAHPQRELVREIDRACARSSELVQRILAFSRPDASERVRKPTRLNDVLTEAVSVVRTTASPHIEIRCQLQPDLMTVMVDDGQVHQMCVNLLTNAIDAVASRGGIIQCSTHSVSLDAGDCLAIPGLHPGEYQCLCIADNGPGIPGDMVTRIFDPFFTTKAKGRGTGLGLSMVHGHMKSHAGAVAVGRSAMGGALFTLYFPVDQNDPSATQTLRALSTIPVQARILYVDDEEPLLMLMSRLLQRAGHQVTTSMDPEEALELFRSAPHEFDLVVSDMSMPAMSGIELARQMLRLRTDLPFVITSGYVDAEQTELAIQAGVRQVMLKPNTVQELGAVIANLAKDMRANHPLLESLALEASDDQ